MDSASKCHVRFRLGGLKFPPLIYYKVFVHGAVCDINAFAPRDYNQMKKDKRRNPRPKMRPKPRPKIFQPKST